MVLCGSLLSRLSRRWPLCHARGWGRVRSCCRVCSSTTCRSSSSSGSSPCHSPLLLITSVIRRGRSKCVLPDGCGTLACLLLLLKGGLRLSQKVV